MPFFGVRLHGEHFILRMNDAVLAMGFYTTRWLRAPDAETAGRLAVRIVHRELAPHMLNEPTETSACSVDAVWQEWRFWRRRGRGFAFYPMNESEYERLQADRVASEALGSIGG